MDATATLTSAMQAGILPAKLSNQHWMIATRSTKILEQMAQRLTHWNDLRALARPGFFALHHPRVSREHACGLKGGSQLGIIQLQRLADAMPEGLGLACHPTTPDCGLDIVIAVCARDGKWREHVPTPLKGGEDVVKAPAVHGDRA